MCLGVVFIVTQVYLDLKMPDYMNKITEISQSGNGAMSDIWINGAYMLLCALGSLACSVITSLFFVRISADFSARLRESLYTKVQSFSMAEIISFSTPSLITRPTNDVQQFQMFLVIGLQMLIKAPITAIWGIVKIADKEWQWSLAIGIAVAVIVVGIVVVMLFVYKKFMKMQTLTDKLNQATRENLTGIRVIRAYNAENYQQEKFENVNREFYRYAFIYR